MKIDIRHGYRIPVFGLGGLVGIVKRMQRELALVAEQAVGRVMSAQCKAALDGLAAGDAWWTNWARQRAGGPESLYTAMRQCMERALVCDEPPIGLGCRAQIYPGQDHLLIAVSGPVFGAPESRDPVGVEDALLTISGLEEFSYVAGELKPAGISDADWSYRSEAWLEVLMAARNGLGIMLEATLIDPAILKVPGPEALDTEHPTAYLTLPLQAVLEDLGIGKPVSIEAAALDGIVEHERAALRKVSP